MFEELSPALEAVLAQGHPGVVIALVGACRRVGAHQAQVLQLLLEVSGCSCKPFMPSLQILPLGLIESLDIVSLDPRDLIPRGFTGNMGE